MLEKQAMSFLLINKVKHTVDLCTFLNNKRRGKQCTQMCVYIFTLKYSHSLMKF